VAMLLVEGSCAELGLVVGQGPTTCENVDCGRMLLTYQPR
jgi:hypothetical protein